MNATYGPIFRLALQAARLASPLVAGATSSPDEINAARYFLSDDGLSGYGITSDGTLVGLFSLKRGQGDALVLDAIAHGASNLDCFDGYLVALYSRHGFKEVDRVPNWDAAGPAVVYMSL